MRNKNIYKLIFEETDELLILIDLKSLSILDVNKKAGKLLGVTKSKNKKFKLQDFFPEEKSKSTLIQFNKIKRKKKGSLENIELQNLKNKRFKACIETTKIRNGSKEIIQCKIIDHSKTLQTFNQCDIKFETLFESTNDAILLLNIDTFIDCNKKTLKMFNCSRYDIINAKLYKFAPPSQPNGKKSREEIQKKISLALKGNSQFFEWKYKKCDGTLFDSEVSLNRIVLKDQVILQAIVRDITDKKLHELTIREQSRRVNTLMGNLPGMVYRCQLNRKWTMEFVSEGCFALTGYKPEDFINDSKISYNDIIHPEDRDRVWIEINYAIEKKKSFTVLYRTHTRNGFERWFWEKGRSVYNESGEIKALEGFIVDITERKIAEEKISMLAHAIKSISECVWITNMNETITFVNNSFCRTYGYEQDEIIGKQISIIRSQNNPAQLINKISALAFEDGWTGELISITKDGREFPALLSTSLIKDDSEKPIALIGIASDITERKKAEEALKQSEERFKSLVDNMLEPAIILSMKGIILFANNSAGSLVEISSSEEAIGKDIFDFLHPDFNSSLKREFVKARKNPDLFSSEFKILTRFNTEKWVEGLGKKISFDGDFSVLITLHDISERKKAEKQLKEAKEYAEDMNKLKSSFLANMSHELRTPLVGILGYSEMLLERIKDPEQLEMVDRILYSGTRLMETLNSVLDLSRIEANRVDVFLEPVNVPAIVKKHIDIFKPAAEKKGLYIRTFFSEENITALLDERFLGQIINNLVSNSIKFTNRGGITVRVSTTQDSSEKLVRISVSDSGIGIPPKNLDTIFEEFRQVSEGINRHFEGSGLGLTITKKFVSLMDGKIKVKSEVGTGSEFIVFFTALNFSDTTNENYKGKSDIAYSQESLLGKTIPEVLFVDDDQSSKEVTKLFLKEICNLTFANSGEEALEKVKHKKFDAILMDINLGAGISGIETTIKIRQLNDYKHTPIVAVTAFAMAGDEDEFINSGCTHYISKPYDRNSISKLMKEILVK